jgi:hypothetical protein
MTLGATAGQNISGVAGNKAANALTSTITFQSTGYASETLIQFAARVVANINANTATSGYLACQISNTVWLSAATITSADVAENIVPTATASLGSGSTPTLSVTVAPTTVGFQLSGGNRNGSISSWTYIYTSENVTASITGGVPPYSYSWTPVSGTSKLTVTDSSTNAVLQSWSTTLKGGSTGGVSAEYWTCTVTDAALNKATSSSAMLLVPVI